MYIKIHKFQIKGDIEVKKKIWQRGGNLNFMGYFIRIKNNSKNVKFSKHKGANALHKLHLDPPLSTRHKSAWIPYPNLEPI